MKNSALVRVAHRFDDLARDVDRFSDWQLSVALDAVAKWLAHHVRHHVEGKLAVHSGVEHFGNSWMMQLRDESYLSHESFDRYRTSKLGTQNFYSDELTVFYVGAEINGRHSTATQLTFVAVMAGEKFWWTRGVLTVGLRWSVRRCQNIAIFRAGRWSQSLNSSRADR